MTNHPLSIAIAGGGIAGLFCAHKLAQRGHRITIFEHLPVVGGRIETLNLSGINCECGPMRFELALQPLLKQLADELRIHFTSFPPAKGEPVRSTKYTLEPDEMSADQIKRLKPNKRGKAASDHSEYTKSLDLLRLGIYRMFHCPEREDGSDTVENVGAKGGTTAKTKAKTKMLWSFAEVIENYKDGTNEIQRFADTLEDDNYNEIRTKVKLANKKLYTMGLWNALDYVLSAGAVAKIRDIGTFYHLIPENPSASEWAIFWLRLFRTSQDLFTIEEAGGVSRLVDQLVGRLRERTERNVDLVTGATVVHVGPAVDYEKIKLGVDFHEPGRVLDLDFDHVILALPKFPLLSLATHFTSEIRRCIDGVNAFPLLKAFAILKNPWWKASGRRTPETQHGAHLVPTREVHYRDHPTDKSLGMVMLYTDRPANAYWAPYIEVPHSRAQVNTPIELRRDLAAQLVALKLNHEVGAQDKYKDEIDTMEATIVGFAIRDWAKPPFGAASHAWLPGVNVPEAVDKLKAFSLIGRPGINNLHICGEAYSDYQGFIEGALRSATQTIEAIRD